MQPARLPSSRLLDLVLRRIGVLITFAFCFCSASPQSIAVNDFLPQGVDSTDAAIISGRLRANLIGSGRLRVMERQQMDQILKQQSIPLSGTCDRNECALQIGKLLSVDRMIVGSVGRLSEIYTLQARVLDVSSGEILFTANQDFEGRIEELLSIAVPKFAARLGQAAQADSLSERAHLYVKANIPGADVYLDGVHKGISPLNLEGIPAGDHRVEIRKDSLIGSAALELRPGDVRRLELALDIGSVKVFTEPAGAKVMMDSATFLGETPLKADQIPMGQHRFLVTKPGYIPQSCILQVLPSRTQALKLAMAPGAYATVRVGVPSQGMFASNGRDSIRRVLPTSLWLPSGKWTLSVEAGKDWEPWVGTQDVTDSACLWNVGLVHSRTWVDSVVAVKNHFRVITWRFALGLASLAAAGGAIFCHLEANHAKSDADRAASDYDAMALGSDFASSKVRYQTAVEDNKNWSNASLATDIAAGVLISGFLFTFAF